MRSSCSVCFRSISSLSLCCTWIYIYPVRSVCACFRVLFSSRNLSISSLLASYSCLIDSSLSASRIFLSWSFCLCDSRSLMINSLSAVSFWHFSYYSSSARMVSSSGHCVGESSETVDLGLVSTFNGIGRAGISWDDSLIRFSSDWMIFFNAILSWSTRRTRSAVSRSRRWDSTSSL